MSWFDRNRGETAPREAFDALTAAFARSGLEAALQQLCGPPGLRRFVVRFQDTSRGLRVTRLESEPVKGGGGPPPPQTATSALPAVERALAGLRKALPAPFSFDRGAIGVVVDRDEKKAPTLDVTLRLDEDGDAYALGTLRQPKGPGVAVEQPGYLATVSAWAEQASRVRSGWKMCRGAQTFAIEGSRLSIHTPSPYEGEDGTTESLVVTVLGTWDARNGDFVWLVEKPVGDEAPFVEPELSLTLGQVAELMALAAAKLGAMGVFQGETGGDVAPRTVFAAIR